MRWQRKASGNKRQEHTMVGQEANMHKDGLIFSLGALQGIGIEQLPGNRCFGMYANIGTLTLGGTIPKLSKRGRLLCVGGGRSPGNLRPCCARCYRSIGRHGTTTGPRR